MYDKGPDIERIEADACNGDRRAAFDLAWCYYIGNGVSADSIKARHWYTQAASGGIREAGEILHILETEAQRASELESLSQQWSSAVLPSWRYKWFVLAALFIVSSGLVGILLYVWSPKSASRFEKTVTQGDKIETPSYMPENAVQNVTSIPAESTKNDGNESVPQTSESLLITEQTGEDTILTEPPTPNEKTPTPLAEKQIPTSVPEKAAPILDMNDIARQAEKWLDGEH